VNLADPSGLAWQDTADDIFTAVSSFGAAFEDTLSFGLTHWARPRTRYVWEDSDGYKLGVGVATIVSAGLTAPATAVRAEMSAASRMAANARQGQTFETAVIRGLRSIQLNVEEQITVRTASGFRTRLDAVGVDAATAQYRLTEAKSSLTAPLTSNQAEAFPEIAKTGCVVVGAGKPGCPGGTIIPPTVVDVLRPLW
jgi:hypothetical protein